MNRKLGAWIVAAAVMLATGCAAGPGHGHHPRGVAGALPFWNRSRLLAAAPFLTGPKRADKPDPAASPHTAAGVSSLKVGALFEHSASGNHFCTASVVASPSKDLLVTAAHCINSGDGKGYNSDIVFIPGYRDGQEPYGAWTPARLFVAPQWASSADPDYDVGFVALQPHDGENIQDVLGANRLGTDLGYRYLVHVTGYPDSANTPITCVNWTSEQSSTQLQFDCSGYTGGTSGSPWVIHFSSLSRTGTIVGVIGGYEQGGDTPSVSYSVRLDAATLRLYQQALAAENTGSQQVTAKNAGRQR